tara:strand:+ start:44634 stop:45053 length:420 start_codon:yes stop_codon:yes gene_type:complete
MNIVHYITLIAILSFSCNSKEDYIQEVYVNEIIDLSMEPYNKLIIPGSAILLDNIGVEGIIIYHGVGNYYKVYDRNCSYEPSLSCSRIDSLDDVPLAYCGCCPSIFEISNTGSPMQLPAMLPLKEYSWSLDNNMLRIFN